MLKCKRPTKSIEKSRLAEHLPQHSAFVRSLQPPQLIQRNLNSAPRMRPHVEREGCAWRRKLRPIKALISDGGGVHRLHLQSQVLETQMSSTQTAITLNYEGSSYLL